MKLIKIPDYENYFAGEDGRIYRKNKKCFRQIAQYIQPYGKYLNVYIYDSGKNKIGIQVHKLIASAFFNANIKKVNVIHKDKNLLNNFPGNLIVSECTSLKLNDEEEAKCNIIKMYENLLLKQINYNKENELWKKYDFLKSKKNKRSIYNWLYVNLKSAS